MPKNRLLHGHDIRHTLMAITLVLHLTELGDLVVANERSWFAKLIPAIAFVSIIVCLIFYNKLEQCGKYSYLIVTIAYWMCCGMCRILLMLTAIRFGLDFSHVTYSTSVFSVLLYCCIATNDLVALYIEVGNAFFTFHSVLLFELSLTAVKHIRSDLRVKNRYHLIKVLKFFLADIAQKASKELFG